MIFWCCTYTLFWGIGASSCTYTPILQAKPYETKGRDSIWQEKEEEEEEEIPQVGYDPVIDLIARSMHTHRAVLVVAILYVCVRDFEKGWVF